MIFLDGKAVKQDSEGGVHPGAFPAYAIRYLTLLSFIIPPTKDKCKFPLPIPHSLLPIPYLLFISVFAIILNRTVR